MDDTLDIFRQFKNDDIYTQFLSEDFDAKIVACKAIQGVAISEHLAKLASGIAFLDKELHNQVAAHYEDLLSQATGIQTLENVLQSMFVSIQNLQITSERLQSKILEPYNKTSNQTAMLARLQMTCDLLRRMGRIFHLSRRLQVQLQGGIKEITKAAQSLNEADFVLEGIDLNGIDVVKDDLKFLREAKQEVERCAEGMLEKGMETQNQTQVTTALQVFYNLQLLQHQVLRVLRMTTDNVNNSVKDALCVKGLSQQGLTPGKGGPGRAAMPVTGNSAAFRATLWTNLEKLMNQICEACCQVQHLEKVLAKKRDPITHVCFLNELKKNGHGNILHTFWLSVTNILFEEFSKAASESTHLKQAFEGEYPKLLNLMNELWKRLAHMEGLTSNYSSIVPNESCKVDGDFKVSEEFNPEEVLRNTLIQFENAYLSRSLSRLLDSVNVAISVNNRDTPTKDDVEGIIKTISSELKVASVDGKLCQTVARNVAKTIHHFSTTCEQLVSMEGDATQVIGHPTASQQLNASVVHLLNLFSREITAFMTGPSAPPLEAVVVIKGSFQYVEAVMANAVEPLLNSVADAIDAIILTMHDEDFSGPASEKTAMPDAPCSLYMKELQRFVARAHHDYFDLLPACELVEKRIQQVACRAIELFVRHASLVRPLGDGGKMRLAADFAQMEMAITPLCQRVGDLGKPYKMLRSFRPLLFQTPAHIFQSPVLGDIIPFSTVLHFLFAKAPAELRSPYEAASWSRSRYSKWLDEHSSEKERLILIRGALESYVQSVKQRLGKEFTPVYPIMAELLQKAMQAEKS